MVEPVRLTAPGVAPVLTAPVGEERVDELLASTVGRDATFQAEVDRWIEYWQHAAEPWFPDFLSRMRAFEVLVDSALSATTLPPSLRYLPLIESGYDPGARSRAAAVGMWQFMAGTARELGLEVGPFVDQRRDPVRSTRAAVAFLEALHGEFGSWFLALAAYNGGPNRTRRILRTHAPLETPSDSLFWALRAHWPPETRAFVPKLFGAIAVASRPERYGYTAPRGHVAFDFDEVTVPDAATFDVLARAAGVAEAEIRWLNPELYRGFAPPGVSSVVRVPPGRGAAFAANFAEIPVDERMTVVEHDVTPGETLSHIARRYGVSVADLRAANPHVRPRYLRVGSRLTVPLLVGRGSRP